MNARALGVVTAALVAMAPQFAVAQTLSCRLPGTIPVTRPDLPDASQPKRVLPIGGYTLAVTWGPEFCQAHKRDPDAAFQCRKGNRFGFTLHGLWPDGEGPQWPQYCAATGLVPPEVTSATLCSTPSAQLIQHEWAKHGTCMGTTPAAYFGESTRLFAALRFPDMAALSRRPGLTAIAVAREVARLNPGIDAGMMRITANNKGWLQEIWFCLDTERRYHQCPAHQGGVAPGSFLKIWRGPR